ncbi:MAG: hypothetical protein F4X94_07025 [Dehalococcoidia bacterium]|nr:hypothetical protein [Dehalococcoidia bacterium]
MKLVADVLCDKAVFRSRRFRPDIALVDEGGESLAVFEVQDTNRVSSEKRDFYLGVDVPVFRLFPETPYEHYNVWGEADAESVYGQQDSPMRQMYESSKNLFGDRSAVYHPALPDDHGVYHPSRFASLGEHTHYGNGRLWDDGLWQLPDGHVGPYPYAESLFNVPCERTSRPARDFHFRTHGFSCPELPDGPDTDTEPKPLNPEAALWGAGFRVVHDRLNDIPVWILGYRMNRLVSAKTYQIGVGTTYEVSGIYSTSGRYRSYEEIDRTMWKTAGEALGIDIDEATIVQHRVDDVSLRSIRCPIPA